MKKLTLTLILLCSSSLFLAGSASGQTTQNPPVHQRSAAEKALVGTGKATVAVVGTAAKISYKTAKFGANHIVIPAVTKGLPKLFFLIF